MLVVGPPGSGKSTLARDLAATHGLAHLEREQYGSDSAYKQAVQRAAANPNARLAVVRTCPTIDEQAQWERLAGATETVVLAVPVDVLTKRIRERNRGQWRAEIQAAKRWHAQRGAHTAPVATQRVNPSRNWYESPQSV